MNRDDIIRMATDAGLIRSGDGWTMPSHWGLSEVERFAKLVAAAEREACAQIVEREAMTYSNPVWALEIVNDIRARGEK